VQQGGGVDELDGRGELQAGVVARPGQAGGGDGQQRPQTLGGAGDQVVGQGRDHRHGAVHVPADQGVDGGHVRTRKLEQRVQRRRFFGDGCACGDVQADLGSWLLGGVWGGGRRCEGQW
jgi:hypothetical protein